MVSSQLSSSAENDSPMLSLRNVVKFYGHVQVLNIESLELFKGDRVVVVGGNASGKSTLLRLLAGITRATRGTVQRSSRMKRLRLGYVPQSGGINMDLTVVENLRIMASLYERPILKDLANWRFVKLFGLEPYLDIPVRDLSGGYQKIAGIVTALSLDPQILFLDEPLSGIDDKYGVWVREIVGELADSLDLLVIADHVSGENFKCTRTIGLAAGCII